MVRNRLLNACSPADLAQIFPDMEEFPLSRGRILYQGGLPIERVYFIEAGLVATSPGAGQGQGAVGARFVGREGMACGVPLLLGATSSPHRRIILASGSALAISRTRYCEALSDLPQFRSQLLLYVNKILLATTQMCACNARHNVQQRLARLLLTAANRLESLSVPFTHGLAAQMLGVRRATVSDCLKLFQDGRLISTERSLIRLQQVDKLSSLACGCYASIAKLDEAADLSKFGWSPERDPVS